MYLTTILTILQFHCSFCAAKFFNNAELEMHRHQTHKTFRPCKNMPQCPYESSCVFNHSIIDTNMFLCFECGEQFETFRELMFHRKRQHTMSSCRKFTENSCPFTDEACWFNHNEPTPETNKNNQTTSKQQGFWEPPPAADQPDAQPSVFRDPPVNLAPPSPQPTQAAWLKMVSMMNNMKAMMKNLQKTNQFPSL